MMDFDQYKIRELSPEEFCDIYQSYLVKHFPEDEVKPLKHICRMWEADAYRVLGLFCGEAIVGYAFVALGQQAKMVLLDYYAILEEYRSQGIGGWFLAKMQNYFEGFHGILIETEDVDYAENDSQKKERVQRDSFYQRNGVVKMSVTGEVYGVHYRLWKLDFEGRNCSNSMCRENYENIYQVMVPGEKYEKYICIRG